MVGAAIGIGLASALPSIFAGISAKKGYDKHAKLLEGMTMDIPGELDIAGEILRQRRGQDMPGYDQAKTNIMGTIPSTMREVMKAADSPSTILAALSGIQEGAATNMRQLDIENAIAKIQADQEYTGFLSNVMAPAKMNKQQYENQAKVAGSESRLTGQSQFWQGLTSGIQQGISGGMGAYTGLSMNQAQTGLLKSLEGYWGNQPGGNAPGMNMSGVNTPINPSQIYSGGGYFG
jgi:hypothetical protein